MTARDDEEWAHTHPRVSFTGNWSYDMQRSTPMTFVCHKCGGEPDHAACEGEGDGVPGSWAWLRAHARPGWWARTRRRIKEWR